MDDNMLLLKIIAVKDIHYNNERSKIYDQLSEIYSSNYESLYNNLIIVANNLNNLDKYKFFYENLPIVISNINTNNQSLNNIFNNIIKICNKLQTIDFITIEYLLYQDDFIFSNQLNNLQDFKFYFYYNYYKDYIKRLVNLGIPDLYNPIKDDLIELNKLLQSLDYDSEQLLLNLFP
jgi:hypothetical protein